MLFAALILCFALLPGHASKCLMFCAGFVARQSQHNLNLDKCSPNSCTRPPSLRLSICLSDYPSAWAASSHISQTLNRCSMADVIGCCHINCACFGRVSVRVYVCVCVGVGVWVCLTHHWTVTQQQEEQHMSVGGPVGRQIPFDVQSAERQRQWSMQKVFQTVQFSSVRFGSILVPLFASLLFSLRCRFFLAFAFFALCRDFGFITHNRQAAAAAVATTTEETTITRSKCANIMKNAKRVAVARVGRTYLPDTLYYNAKVQGILSFYFRFTKKASSWKVVLSLVMCQI